MARFGKPKKYKKPKDQEPIPPGPELEPEQLYVIPQTNGPDFTQSKSQIVTRIANLEVKRDAIDPGDEPSEPWDDKPGYDENGIEREDHKAWRKETKQKQRYADTVTDWNWVLSEIEKL